MTDDQREELRELARKNPWAYVGVRHIFATEDAFLAHIAQILCFQPERHARICWQSKVTGEQGHGDYIRESIAISHIKRLQRGLSDCDYWLEYEGEG